MKVEYPVGDQGETQHKCLGAWWMNCFSSEDGGHCQLESSSVINTGFA